jgi:hypothetical protein
MCKAGSSLKEKAMLKMKKVYLRRVIINGKLYIAIRFKFDQQLITRVKTLHDAYWNSRIKEWIVFDRKNVVKRIKSAFEGMAEVDYQALKPNDAKADFSKGTSRENDTLSDKNQLLI